MATELPDVAAIADVRICLTNARIDARKFERDYLLARARGEVREIERVGGAKLLGANNEDRVRALLIALAEDPEVQAAETAWIAVVKLADELQAELDNVLDVRRAYEWDVRARTATALERFGMTLEMEHSIDDVADAAIAEASRVVADNPYSQEDAMYAPVPGSLTVDDVDADEDLDDRPPF